MSSTKSYRIRTNPSAGENYKLNVSLNQDYDFIDILSLKLNQKNLYTTPVANYGCIIDRVIANGGVGVPNAHVSIFIPATKETKNDIIKHVLYPYDTTNDKNYKNIRYNLLRDKSESNDECYRVVGSLPLKRVVLDNNDVLEIFNEYYKYSTVTNSHGDYMLFGIPTGNCQIHCDVDISDCGILSQKPRDMFYAGYNMEQFESSTQFKSDTNLNNLAQIFSEDSSVYVYPFWGDESENEVGITRYDINISYKFETTCVFIGCCVTDSDNATTHTTCQPQKNMGRMSELTSRMGTIEMIRLEPNGMITNVKIKGNQLIDGNGVWCYQIPMNMDYVTTDEFGNEIISDNPEIGVATRTDVRFKFKLEGGSDNRYKACHLVPHNPSRYEFGTEVSYDFDLNTPKNQFVSLFKNNIYSVKSYIPRLQNTTSAKSQQFIGIKSIEGFGSNTPFPYNDMSSRLPVAFTILCVIALTIIMFANMINVMVTKLPCVGCPIKFTIPVIKRDMNLGDPCHTFIGRPFCDMFSLIGCISINTSWCPYANVMIWPGCNYDCEGQKGKPCKKIINKMDEEWNEEGTEPARGKNREFIENCAITALAEDMGVSSFHFTNDWINGCLYFPTFNYKKKRKKRRKFFIFGKYKTRIWEEVCAFENEELIQDDRKDFYKKGLNQHTIYQTCSPSFSTTESNYLKHVAEDGSDGKKRGKERCRDHLFDRAISKRKELKSHVNKNICILEYSYYRHKEPFVNRQEVDKDKTTNESIYEYYYRPITQKTSTTGAYGNLFKTDIILIGSIDECNKDGIWQLHNELPTTTFQMPGEMFELDYPDPDTSDFVQDVDGDELDIGDAMFVASGKNWGYRGGVTNLIPKGTNEQYRFYSRNNVGGLFYGIGCARFETKMKTCANLKRICQIGVDLDVVMSKDDNCSEQIVLSPQGFIGKDQLIRGFEIRQKFATLNNKRLNTYDVVTNGKWSDGTNATPTSGSGTLPNGTIRQNLVFNNGKRYYNFEYLYPNNFDSMLSLSFVKDTKDGSINSLTRTLKSHFNTANETYIDKDYFKFIYGVEKVVTEMGLQQKNVCNNRGVSFFQPKNSFSFYFGLKSGSTAIEIFRQKYFANCFQETEETAQVQISVIQHPYVCSCGTAPNTLISVNIVGVTSRFSITIKNMNNVTIFPKTEYEENQTKLQFSSSTIPELSVAGTYTFILEDDYKNVIYNNVTLIKQNKVNFRLEQKTHIFSDIPSSVNCNTSLVMDEQTPELRAKTVIKNIINIKNKGCKLRDYELVVSRIFSDIGTGAQFRIGSVDTERNCITKLDVTIVSNGLGYIVGAVGQISDGGAYIKVKTINAVGGITDFDLVNSSYQTDPYGNYGYGYTTEHINTVHTVEKMIKVEDEVVINPIKADVNYYDNASEETVRDWEGFILYLCAGEYTVCLRNTVSGCGEDEHCEYINIFPRPPISLVFNDKISARLFKPIQVGNIIYTTNGTATGEDSNIWWDRFFTFLRETGGKKNDVLLNELLQWYGPDTDLNIDTVQSYISTLKEIFMPICPDDGIRTDLGGVGHAPPYKTLLYGRNEDNNGGIILTANDLYNRVIHTDHPDGVNIPYQTEESSFNDILSDFSIRKDDGTFVDYPVPSVDRKVNLTPEGITFTASMLPIPLQKDSNIKIPSKIPPYNPIEYYSGGFYAGVIGENGVGNAAGHNTSLTTIVKLIKGNNEEHQVEAWEVKEELTRIPGNFINKANEYLFRFHILDQTLKVFSEWNRISAEYKNYYEPDACSSRYIPPHIDVYYVNGPGKTNLTVGRNESPFDLVGGGETEWILNDEVFIPTLVADNVYHLGTCPSKIPNIRRFHSTSRTEPTNISIEQRYVVSNDGDVDVTVECETEIISGSDLSLEIKNNKVKVTSFITCNNNTISSVVNNYSHMMEINNIEDYIIDTIIDPDLRRFELYELPFAKYEERDDCGGYGGSLKWFRNIGTVSSIEVFSRGTGYKVDEQYTIGGDTNVIITITRVNSSGGIERVSSNITSFSEWSKGSVQMEHPLEYYSDLYCMKPQSRDIAITPEELLYYGTTDTWENRFNYPYYTKPNTQNYAGIDPQKNEPNITCVGDSNDSYTKNTIFKGDTIKSIMLGVNPNNSHPKTSFLSIFLPFNGNVTVPTNNTSSGWNRSIFFNIIHDNNTGVRAFSQPMDFGNYIYIDESKITFTPNPSTGGYTINMTIELKGRLAFSCYRYTYKIEEGDYELNFPVTSEVSLIPSGWELFDTRVTSNGTTSLLELSTGTFVNGKTIRFIRSGLSYVYEREGRILSATGLRFSCTDKEKLIRISVTDVSGVENYTYISLFKWIDNDENLTYCIYNCNLELKRELNTGFVIDFEWRNNVTKDIGVKMVYVTKTNVFPADSTNPSPILIQGKNLIKTNAFNTTSGGTTLSDGTTLDFDYKGILYLWFNENDNHVINKVKGDSMTPVSISVSASSCFILYKVLIP